MEEDLVKIEKEIRTLEAGKVIPIDKTSNMELVMKYVGYYLEHLEDLLLRSPNPLQRGSYFGLVFTKTPTYQELISGTPKLAPCIALKGASGHLSIPIGEPTGPILEHLLDSLLRTDARLHELGFTYYNGNVVVTQYE